MLIAPVKAFGEFRSYDFLAQVLPAMGNHWMIMVRRPSSKSVTHESFEDIETLVQRVLILDAEGYDVWHAMGSFSHRHSSLRDGTTDLWGRKQGNVAYLASFWLDIDVDAHKAGTYRTIEEARGALKAFAERNDLHPNWIVESGSGLHVYWVLSEDVPRDRWNASARKFKQAVKLDGLLADPTRTADSTSVMRPVGTISKKRNRPVLGSWVRYGAISLAAFDQSIENITSSKLPRLKGTEDSDEQPTCAGDADKGRWFSALPEHEKVAVLDQMLRALPLSYCKSYSRWLAIGASLRGTIGVPDTTLFGLWKAWSQQVQDWSIEEEELHRVKWNGLNRSTVGTLIYHASKFGWRREPTISDPSKMAVRVQSVEAARMLIRHDYAYAKLDNKFVCRDGSILSVESFERSMARLMPLDSNGRPISAVHIATRYGAAELVAGPGYAPGREFIYVDKATNAAMANTYQAPVVVELPPTDLELRALRIFRKHLVSNDASTEEMLRYFDNAFAFLVQNPSERIPKVFLLIGETQGSGKSTYILGFSRALFGRQNVGKVTNSEIRSNFNDWMTNSQIVCLEEIWMTNRKDSRDLVNSLKDNITDEVARIHPKGAKGFQMTNPATYFASSNHLDAVDLAEGDRRWAIAHTRAGALDERFAKWLHHWLQPGQRGPGVLRHIYRQISLEGFNPYGAVPYSQAKADVIELSQTDVERLVFEAWSQGIGPFKGDITTLEDVHQFACSELRYSVSRKSVQLALQAGRLDVIGARAKKERGGKTFVRRVWITRNHHLYEELGPASLLDAYEAGQHLARKPLASLD